VEYLGIREPFLFKWELKKNGCLKSQVEPVAFSNLSLDASNLIRNYYSDKWSMFNESLLTNEEKAEIVGDLLSTSVLVLPEEYLKKTTIGGHLISIHTFYRHNNTA
jgi:hypothetical protein